MLFKGEEIENTGLMCFSVGKKTFWKCDFPTQVLLENKSKMAGGWGVLKFLQGNLDIKHLMLF